ncbi:MAG: hypothetical protein ACSHX5_05785 [Phycisphaerales bacterium]
MQFSSTLIATAMLATIVTASVADTTIVTDRDYMTSGFFSADPQVRGDNDGRGVNRVSSINPFGVFNENTYLEFNDTDWSSFDGPVDSAIFQVEMVSGGFGADSSEENPFAVSLHSLQNDPWTTIDHLAHSGPSYYQSFVNSEITSSSVVATTSVAGSGVYEWDITALVNDWIVNGSSNFAYTIALSGILDTSGSTFLQGIVNSSDPSLTGSETIGQIVLVPAPGALACIAGAGLFASRRRRA